MASSAITGRGTKRKWKRLAALLMAATALSAAWLAAHPEIIGHAARYVRQRLIPAHAGQWVEFPGSGSACAMAGDTLITQETGRICAFDPEGRLRWSEETALGEPMLRSCGGRAVLYEPGGTELRLADRSGLRTLPVSSGIDAAVLGSDGQAAVITAGSGYLTETWIFDPKGSRRASRGFSDRAAVFAAFLENGQLAQCCLSPAGQWSLLMEEMDPIPLTAELVYDMRTCGDGVALWTCDGIELYDEDGRRAGALAARGQMLDWACGSFAALLCREAGSYRLLTLWPGGSGESETLPEAPLELAVTRDRAALLGRETVTVLDRSGTLLRRSPAGAGHIFNVGDGLILVGDGRFRFIP